MVRKTIEKTILKHNLINKREHIVIGLSGGPDSVCLFHVLNQLREELDFALYAVHVNHGFRPGAAEADQEYVEQLCKKKGITCASFTYDCNAIAKDEGLSSEEAGRKVRYEAFRKVANALIKNGIAAEKIKVAVAQNAQDQAETVLLRLMRGTGPDGLAGMAYDRKEGSIRIIRPLLDVHREQIEAYCSEHCLQPRIDRTNLEPIYTRNKVRLRLIPYLQEYFNVNIIEALIRLSKIAAEDKEYLWKITERTYKELMIEPGVLKQEEMKSLEPSIRRRVILKALSEAGLSQDVTAAHLEKIDQLIREGQTSKSLDLPYGYTVSIEYENIRFYKKSMQSPPGLQDLRLKIEVTEPQDHYPKGIAVFDWEKICRQYPQPEIQLRSRQAGDYIRLKSGRKKLQDFFVDQKVPRDERDRIPVAAIGSEILWVAAHKSKAPYAQRYSEKYKLDTETKKTLMLEIICGI